MAADEDRRPPRRAVVEIKSEEWAKMQLLAHSAKLSDREIQNRASRPSPDLGKWPTGNQSRERGIAACEVLKGYLPSVINAAGLDPNGEISAEILYRYVFESGLDYWTLANLLSTDKLTREWLAMEGGVCHYVVWPKQETQFFYATHLPRAINECDVAGCIAILGSFILWSKQNSQTRVKSASSYYLLKNGELHKRGTWRSQTCGFDEERLMMVYDLDEPQTRRYAGLISIERNRRQDPIIEKEHYIGTRCFKGVIYTLGDPDFRSGPFVAEEVRTTYPNDSSEEALLSDHEVQAEFVKRLDIAATKCRYCSVGKELATDKCGFISR